MRRRRWRFGPGVTRHGDAASNADADAHTDAKPGL